VVASGAPLLELGDTARIEVVAELLTSDAALARPGSAVRIERWGGPGALAARVRRVEPAAFTKVSALGVEEQRVNVLIDLDEIPDGTVLGDGWRVVARIVTRREAGVLTVPVSAVFPWPQGAAAAEPPGAAPAMGVFVVESGRARLRAVQIGGRNGSVAWIRDGMREGEPVIVYPPPAVVDGVRVQPRGR
jgi:HlyD family secretion protein